MTNPTLEQRAREIALALINERRRFSGFDPHASLDELQPHQFADQLRYANAILALPTFSHTGVEQAIEACAKVAENISYSIDIDPALCSKCTKAITGITACDCGCHRLRYDTRCAAAGTECARHESAWPEYRP